jgi:NAD(P)H-hydrate epimerase
MRGRPPLKRVKHLPRAPRRPDDSNKGTFGRVLVVGGSRTMSGAACLAGVSALRGGAGLVTVAIPRGVQSVVAGAEPSYLTFPLPEDAEGRLVGEARGLLEPMVEKQTALAVGPGMGQSVSLASLVGWLFTIDRPAVFDADALNMLARSPAALSARRRVSESLPARILTPHPGEFARLIRREIAEIQDDREGLAAEFAREHHVILVLKGHRTVITDGERLAVNATGNAGMATGGTGDVLTGLIAALVGQGMPAFEAAQLGVYLHGLAGDLAARALSKPGLIASDLPRWLAEAWRRLGKDAGSRRLSR